MLWKTTCPIVQGTQLVYYGRAGKTWFNSGGGGNYQCMPNDPEYSTYKVGLQGHTYMYGVEYHQPIKSSLHDHNVPCAVCSVSVRGVAMMIPAKLTCPSSWTLEYSGYLKTEYHTTAMYECVDSSPESVPGSGANIDGGVFHHVEASCNGFASPPYVGEKELTCAVCTI